mmetsp:Transcript_9147/g.33761  ORF Transcript_9147/g.33761 Transcript_9147/m.33761 type:complete len:224 (-) Transcript_9147:2398-3069(-)
MFARLSPTDRRSVMWNIFCLSLCLVAAQFTIFFQLPLLIIVVVIVGIIFTSLLLNLRRLQFQLQIYRDELVSVPNAPRLTATPSFKKLQLLRRFQYLITTYFILEMSVRISEIILSWNMRTVSSTTDWISPLVHESLELALAVSVLFLFRLRSFKNMDRFNDSITDFGLIQPATVPTTSAAHNLGIDGTDLSLAKDKDNVLVFEHAIGVHYREKEYSVAFEEG